MLKEYKDTYVVGYDITNMKKRRSNFEHVLLCDKMNNCTKGISG